MDQIINVAKQSEIKRGWYKTWGTPWGISRKKTIKYMKNRTNYQKKELKNYDRGTKKERTETCIKKRYPYQL